jgi:hypothetical protein
MLMTGIALLGTAIPFPEAQAYPSAPQPTPPVDAAAGPYIFQDDFDGPLGAPPDTPSGRFSTGTKTSRRRFWVIGATIAEMCSSTATPIWSSAPPKKGPTTTAAKFKATGRGIGHTWEARMQFNCLTPGCWPAFWMVNEEPLPDGEVDVVEWYGNRRWAPREAQSTHDPTGRHGQGETSPNWWTARGTRGDADGRSPAFPSGETTSRAQSRTSPFRRSRSRVCGRSTSRIT